MEDTDGGVTDEIRQSLVAKARPVVHPTFKHHRKVVKI